MSRLVSGGLLKSLCEVGEGVALGKSVIFPQCFPQPVTQLMLGQIWLPHAQGRQSVPLSFLHYWTKAEELMGIKTSTA
jgi:hypothetical protein